LKLHRNEIYTIPDEIKREYLKYVESVIAKLEKKLLR
jgi:hypothetical protein